MTEGHVYIATKAILTRVSATLVAGQPPSGTDHLPVVEIKDPARVLKGSRGAFKPDLIAWFEPHLFVIECKPKRSIADIAKLHEVLDSPERLYLLHHELTQRGILMRSGITLSAQAMAQYVIGAIAYHEARQQEERVAVIGVDGTDGRGVIVYPRITNGTFENNRQILLP